jgi:hypothetical protein
MSSITISGVDESLKRRLQVACARLNTDMSTVLRAKLPDIVKATEYDARLYEQDLEQIRRDVTEGGEG